MALKAGNPNLVLQYNKDYFFQQNSLLMGISDSSDLAILYGWFFKQQVKILNHLSIPFYRHFINNIFGIVYTSSEVEVVQIISVVKFDGCVIEWGASDKFLPFLDMTIYYDADNCVQYMPF
jgi:hypothetical protein